MSPSGLYKLSGTRGLVVHYHMIGRGWLPWRPLGRSSNRPRGRRCVSPSWPTPAVRHPRLEGCPPSCQLYIILFTNFARYSRLGYHTHILFFHGLVWGWDKFLLRFLPFVSRSRPWKSLSFSSHNTFSWLFCPNIVPIGCNFKSLLGWRIFNIGWIV